MDERPAVYSWGTVGLTALRQVGSALDDAHPACLFRLGLGGSAGTSAAVQVVRIDVDGLDVIDFFGVRALADIAEMARLRGAPATVIGIQPDVALAVVELGLGAASLNTAVDLDDALSSSSLKPESLDSKRQRSTPPQWSGT
ncbi:STAS domain-containing protein [Microlunatus aurantiacus]|uniref:STAS domain-containing protein n=1 Tax=Microlunatus aurantiacus TaxID=446786 RepID=UPI0031DA6839